MRDLPPPDLTWPFRMARNAMAMTHAAARKGDTLIKSSAVKVMAIWRTKSRANRHERGRQCHRLGPGFHQECAVARAGRSLAIWLAYPRMKFRLFIVSGAQCDITSVSTWGAILQRLQLACSGRTAIIRSSPLVARHPAVRFNNQRQIRRLTHDGRIIHADPRETGRDNIHQLVKGAEP